MQPRDVVIDIVRGLARNELAGRYLLWRLLQEVDLEVLNRVLDDVLEELPTNAQLAMLDQRRFGPLRPVRATPSLDRSDGNHTPRWLP